MGSEYEIQGRKIKCQFCGCTNFTTRKTILDTRGFMLFNMGWANKSADNYICDDCGHIMWFMPK